MFVVKFRSKLCVDGLVCVCVCVCVTMEMFGVNTVVFYGKSLVIRCRRDVGGLHVLLSLMEKMLRYLAHTCNYFVINRVFVNYGDR